MLIQPATLGCIREVRTGVEWSSAQLMAAVHSRATNLASRGIGRGSRVLIARRASASFFADLFAVWQRGACAACVDAKLSTSELSNLVGFLQPALVLADAGFTASGDVAVECLDGIVDGSAGPADDLGSLDDEALVLFTSGTTGDPKGVVHTFRSLLARVSLNRTHIGDAALARTLCMLPSHFGHGLIGNCLTPLLAGHELHLVPFDRDTAATLGEEIDNRNITFFSSVPTMWRMLLEAGAAPPKNGPLRVQVGSAPLSADLWNEIIEWSQTRDVVNAYGITETANWISGASAAEFEPADGLIGRAWGGQLAVRLDDGTISATGEGELLVASPSLMSGYLQRDDLTREVLSAGWFHTGDTGIIDEALVARIAGRRKNEINRSGVKIQPEDVDLVIEKHASVADVCVFGIEDEMRGQIVGCAVRVVSGTEVSIEALREWCAEFMRPHAIPEQWFFVDEIPKTDRGKVNRQKVRDHCIAPTE